MDAVPELVLSGEGVNGWFGISIDTAGGLNGDGITDSLIAAHGNDIPAFDAGRIYLYEAYAGPGETPRGSNLTVIPRDVTTGTTPARLTYDRVTRGGGHPLAAGLRGAQAKLRPRRATLASPRAR